MKFSDLSQRLSEKQKQRQANENRGGLSVSDKLELTYDQLGSVAGGLDGFWVKARPLPK